MLERKIRNEEHGWFEDGAESKMAVCKASRVHLRVLVCFRVFQGDPMELGWGGAGQRGGCQLKSAECSTCDNLGVTCLPLMGWATASLLTNTNDSPQASTPTPTHSSYWSLVLAPRCPSTLLPHQGTSLGLSFLSEMGTIINPLSQSRGSIRQL